MKQIIPSPLIFFKNKNDKSWSIQLCEALGWTLGASKTR